jgi:ApbE superfamily uncharacterized protein (UPF0280 family)
MATTYKVLGQAAPSATTETDLYIAPVSAVASSIIVCNRGTTQATFRVSIAVGGGATANKDYIYYDLLIAGNDTFIATIGVTLAANDKVKVYASSGNLSFSLYGSQIS